MHLACNLALTAPSSSPEAPTGAALRNGPEAHAPAVRRPARGAMPRRLIEPATAAEEAHALRLRRGDHAILFEAAEKTAHVHLICPGAYAPDAAHGGLLVGDEEDLLAAMLVIAEPASANGPLPTRNLLSAAPGVSFLTRAWEVVGPPPTVGGVGAPRSGIVAHENSYTSFSQRFIATYT